MRRWTLTVLAAAALVLLGAAACGDDRTGAPGDTVRVVVSLPLFADFVSEVGGEEVEVAALIPSGADPETFEPTPDDIRRLSEADAVFINGRGLEASLERAIESNVPADTPVIRFADRLDGENPHFWLSVDNAAVYVREIVDTLSQVDPAGAARYQEDGQAYSEELTSLAGELREAVSSIPSERRKLVTTHDAFPYFADYLGLELIGFVSRSEAQEPSPRDIQALLSDIRSAKAPAVFSEPGFRDAVLKEVAAETGVPVCLLYSDALDDRVKTYVEMMRFNAGELVRCLGEAAGG